LSELDEIQRVIAESPDSPFNKVPLLTKITADGNITLTPSSLTVWVNGKMVKKDIDDSAFKELAKTHFKMKIH
jgi:N-hydroxyarylamine O-acetyltransferase